MLCLFASMYNYSTCMIGVPPRRMTKRLHLGSSTTERGLDIQFKGPSENNGELPSLPCSLIAWYPTAGGKISAAVDGDLRRNIALNRICCKVSSVRAYRASSRLTTNGMNWSTVTICLFRSSLPRSEQFSYLIASSGALSIPSIIH